MKNFKYLLFILALVLSFSFSSADAAGTTPDAIKTKEDLIYQIMYNGGKVKLTGDTIKLLGTVNLGTQSLLFDNEEDITIDLNGYGILANDTPIVIRPVATKDLKIYDSKKSAEYTKKGFIKSQNASAIINNSSRKATFDFVRIISLFNNQMAIYTGGNNTMNFSNCYIEHGGYGFNISDSTVTISDSIIKAASSNSKYGVFANGKSNITLNDVNIEFYTPNVIPIDYKTNAIYLDNSLGKITINGGTYNSYSDTVQIENGHIIINDGTFTSQNNFALNAKGYVDSETDEVSSPNVTINGGKFIAKKNAAVMVNQYSKDIVINKANLVTESSVHGAMFFDKNKKFSDYIGNKSFIKDSYTENFNTMPGVAKVNEQNITVLPKPVSEKLSSTVYTYNGYVKTPTVTIKDSLGKNLIKDTDYKLTYASGRKNVGKYSVKITYINNYAKFGTKNLYFQIKPKSTYITSLKGLDNKFNVKVKKMTTQTRGYQIAYSTNSKFNSQKTYKMKNTQTSVNLKGLNKKKYYVKVRTYKVVNGVTYYSDWSKVKTVYTK